MLKNLSVVVLLMVLVAGSVSGAAEVKETDVVVVGGGVAGLCAALEASDAGADVVLLEKQAFLGGSALISGGVIYAAGTPLQEALGIEGDTADDMFRYWMNHSHWNLDPALVRMVADQSAEVYDWFVDLGVEFPEIYGTVDDILYGSGGLYNGGIDGTPRAHTAADAGVGLTSPVVEKAQEQDGITIMMETTGTELILENGRVVGVKADSQDGSYEIQAPAVVLATGGMGHNEELQRRYIPEIAASRSRVTVISVEGTTGDGIVMGKAAGAAVRGMDQGAFMLEPSFAAELGTPYWLIYVNQDGQRFVREDAPHPAMNEVFREQRDRMAWAICDDEAREGAWEDIEEHVEAGNVVKADSLEELARLLGISAQGLQNTVDRYNADVEEGSDQAFFKESDFLKPIETPPFYGVQLVESTVGVPTGGLRISTKAEVLTAEGDAIPGLYAAGETTGGILGHYPSSGAAITDAVVFGKTAGKEAAQQ